MWESFGNIQCGMYALTDFAQRSMSQGLIRISPKVIEKKRDKKQLERYVIMSESWAQEKIPRLERELVTIPKDFDEFDENISLTIYKNKIAYIDFSTQTSIIIEQWEIAEFQRKVFVLLFKSLKK